MDVAWDLTIWTINNVSNGIPGAFNNVSFAAFEPTISPIYTDDVGRVFLPDFIGQRWTSTGGSSFNTADILCGYDGQSNSTSAVLDQDRVVYCILPLDNQAPFIQWTTPEDGSIFPSQSEVEFNASDSWDLDNDLLSYEWSSSIDGVFATQTDLFVANELGSGIGLSDGIHQITLKICDPGHCVSETRTIELVNLAPVLVVDFEPALNPWSELIMPQTGTVTINTTGT